MEPGNNKQSTAVSEVGNNGSAGRSGPSALAVEAPPHPAAPFIDRRKKPRIRETPPVPPPPPKLEDYEGLIG